MARQTVTAKINLPLGSFAAPIQKILEKLAKFEFEKPDKQPRIEYRRAKKNLGLNLLTFGENMEDLNTSEVPHLTIVAQVPMIAAQEAISIFADFGCLARTVEPHGAHPAGMSIVEIVDLKWLRLAFFDPSALLQSKKEIAKIKPGGKKQSR